MRYFFILAYLPGQDYELTLVMEEGGKVLRFTDMSKAVDWCANYLAPDWEWVIVPLKTVEIHDYMEEFKVGGTD